MKRSKGETTHYVFEGTEAIFEKNITTGKVRSYVYALGKHFARVDGVVGDSEAEVYYYHNDHLGSVRAVSDENGEVVWSADYLPFGRQVDWEGNGFSEWHGFTGKAFDESTGLHYFNARWYDPELGRFVSEDPIKDGVNWYAYCGNNPLSWIDPTGLGRYEVGLGYVEDLDADLGRFFTNYGATIDDGFQTTLNEKPDNAYINLYKVENLYKNGIFKTIELLYFDATQDIEKIKAFMRSVIYDVMVYGEVTKSTNKSFEIEGVDLEAYVGISVNAANFNSTFAEAWVMDQSRIQQEQKALESFLGFSVAAGTNYGYYNNKCNDPFVYGPNQFGGTPRIDSGQQYVNLASEQRTQHILYGDATGGGHLWPGQPGKSLFPQSWSADKTMHHVSDIATDPSLTGVWTRGRTGSFFTRSGLSSRYYVDGIREGITIRVVIEPAGEGIITAFPLGQ